MNSDDTLDTLLRDLKHHRPEQRIQTIQKLSNFRNRPDVVEAVAQRLVTDPHTMVRIAAAQCLGTLGDPSAIPALLAALRLNGNLSHATGQDHPRRLLVALRPYEELCQTALDSLKMLVPDPKTLYLLRVVQIPPDPEILREATAQFPPAPWYKLTIPYAQEQAYALQQLTELHDGGNIDDLPRLCLVLEHARMNSTVLQASLEALLAIAHRHPTADLRSVSECLKRQTLRADASASFRSALRKLEALGGFSRPRPAASDPSFNTKNLPRLAAETPCSTTDREVSSTAPQTPSRTPILRVARVSPRRILGLTAAIICEIAYISFTFHNIGNLITFFLVKAPQFGIIIWIIIPTFIRMLLSLSREIGQEEVNVEKRRLIHKRCWGPLRRTRTLILTPDARVLVVPQKQYLSGRLFEMNADRHLAVLGPGRQPFRFAFGRTPEELERLAEIINTYLASQAASSPPTAELSECPEESAAQINAYLEAPPECRETLPPTHPEAELSAEPACPANRIRNTGSHEP